MKKYLVVLFSFAIITLIGGAVSFVSADNHSGQKNVTGTPTAVGEQTVSCDQTDSMGCVGRPPVPPALADIQTDKQTLPTDDPVLTAGWLDHLNSYRANAGLPAVTEQPSWTEGCELHSRYMVKNDYLGHSEDPNKEWYTDEGLAAAKSGNVAVHGSVSASDNSFIDMWMEGPFHALGIIDPRLEQAAFGAYHEAIGRWQSAATLDVLRGLGSVPDSVSYPVMFPGNGKEMPFKAFTGNEWPDPLTSCPGYAAPSGPAIMLMLEETPSVSGYSISKTGGSALTACLFDETSYVNSASNDQRLGRGVLASRHAIVLMPKDPLTDGTYNVAITSNGTQHAWSFCIGDGCSGNVEPTATPLPLATATATASPTAMPSPTPSPAALSSAAYPPRPHRSPGSEASPAPTQPAARPPR